MKKAHEGFLDGFRIFWEKKKFFFYFLLKSFILDYFSKYNVHFESVLICWVLIAVNITKISMESSPQEDEGGRQFYQALRDLKFSPTPGRGLDSKVFSTAGIGGVPPSLAKILPIPSPPKKSPQ